MVELKTAFVNRPPSWSVILARSQIRRKAEIEVRMGVSRAIFGLLLNLLEPIMYFLLVLKT